MIESKFTVTLLGAIPHLEVFTDYGLVRAPVLLRMSHDLRKPAMPIRVQNGAGFRYALPGGQEFTP
jgi:hypothetical protein